MGYIPPPLWHATVARPCVLVRAESMPKAAKHGLGKSLLDELVQRTLDGSMQALPRGGPCPPGGHCAALDGPTRLRSPSTRSPRSGGSQSSKGRYESAMRGERPASRAGRQPERRRCGAVVAEAEVDNLEAGGFFARFGREPTGPLPTVIPAHTGGTPLGTPLIEATWR